MGDRIVSINGQCVDGESHSDIVSMLKNSYGNISLQVAHTQLILDQGSSDTCVSMCVCASGGR